MKRDILICSCENPEHQIIVSYLDKQVYLTIHLVKLPFFQRLWKGIAYIFGYCSKYGAFDEFILDKNDSDKILEIKKYLDEV